MLQNFTFTQTLHISAIFEKREDFHCQTYYILLHIFIGQLTLDLRTSI